ncbi:MAG: cytochrome c maturation protein CcmE [Alphaproteobacteria bacterium]|nr:cytochrome c maturation protein CcmE [Alphaproteobacteria bacterium]
MHFKVKQRLRATLGLLFGATLAVGLILWGFSSSVTYFVLPAELLALPSSERVRLGGIVKTGSVSRARGMHQFTVEDDQQEVTVTFVGILPDLFREGQTVIAIGTWDTRRRVLTASEVLAKHDENYRPAASGDPAAIPRKSSNSNPY